MLLPGKTRKILHTHSSSILLAFSVIAVTIHTSKTYSSCNLSPI